MNELPKEAKELLPIEGQRLIENEGTSITLAVKDLKVQNKEDYEAAVSLGASNSKVLKGIESFRLALVKPIKDHIKKIDELFNKLKKPFEDNDQTIRAKLLPYQNSRKTIDVAEADGGMKTVRTEQGKATVSKVMKFEVVDPASVPREWLCVDESKIGKAVRARLVGMIPGIKIWEEAQTSFSAK